MATTTPEVVSIKRYPNRRLYDRQARRYITLQDLEALVLQGKKIEVRDSKTGEDLTRAILTQILLERHPEKMEMFPVAMLHGILQANDMVLEFFRTYLRQSLAILEQMQQPTPLAPSSRPWTGCARSCRPRFPSPPPSPRRHAGEPRGPELANLRDGGKNQAPGTTVALRAGRSAPLSHPQRLFSPSRRTRRWTDSRSD